MPLSFGGRSGGPGGGLILRTPPDEFSGGTLAQAAAARDNARTGITDTAPFDANPNLAVILTATNPDPDETHYFVRRGGRWADATNTLRGPAGRPGADAGPAVVETLEMTVSAAQTRAMATRPVRIGPEVAAGQMLHVHNITLVKPAGVGGTGTTGLFMFYSTDGAAPRRAIVGAGRFFEAAADQLTALPRVVELGQSVWIATGDSCGRNLRDMGAQDQDVEVAAIYSLIDFP